MTTVTLTPTLIAELCGRYLSRDEQRFVAETCDRVPSVVATMSANGDKLRAVTGAEAARWFLDVCRDAHKAGSA